MLNRLTKSAEVQARLDEEYFKINMEGHQMRLKLENTLKNCHQVGKGASRNRMAKPQALRRCFQLGRFFRLRDRPGGKAIATRFTSPLICSQDAHVSDLSGSTCFTLGFPDHPGAGEAAGGSAGQQSEEIQPPDVQLRPNAEPRESVCKLVLVPEIRPKSG